MDPEAKRLTASLSSVVPAGDTGANTLVEKDKANLAKLPHSSAQAAACFGKSNTEDVVLRKVAGAVTD